jgi:hypothetical protein
MTKPPPIPEGYGTVTPWVVTCDTRRLLEFTKDAFDATELGRVEVARRFQDPKFTEAMQYVQSTLAAGLDTA